MVSNRARDAARRSIADGGVGQSSIAEVRMVETLEFGAPRTPFLAFGDRVRIEMFDRSGTSIFGAIDQKLARYEVPD